MFDTVRFRQRTAKGSRFSGTLVICARRTRQSWGPGTRFRPLKPQLGHLGAESWVTKLPSSSEALAHLFSCPLETGVEVAQNLSLPRVPVGGEVLRAGGGHVNQVVPRLLQQQAGEQGLGASKDRRKVRRPRQRDNIPPEKEALRRHGLSYFCPEELPLSLVN